MAIRKIKYIDFIEDQTTILIKTKNGQFRIIESDGGLKISLLASDGDDVISIQPKATNMVVLNQLK